jgi:hypothetical protein
MLVQFALTAVALFGIAALTIDMGLARLTQSQMQTAADSAALEGVRFRDAVAVASDPVDPDSARVLNAFASDCARRQAAAEMAVAAFANPDANDDRVFGAGPQLALSGGEGDADAFAQIDEDAVARPQPYKPSLQANQEENANHGDMVSGDFDPTRPSLEGVPGAPYERADFTPGAAVDADPQYLPGCEPLTPNPAAPTIATPTQIPDRAFLVRLRRTTDPNGLDNEPGVSSSGPTLPWLFARGTIIHSDPASGHNIRSDGITVRATAIAATAPALAVGAPDESLALLGVTPFVLRREFFASLTNDPTTTVPATIEADGSISAGVDVDTTCDAPGAPPGRVGAFSARPLTGIGTLPTAIAAATAPLDIRGFVPIVDCVATRARVIGFGRAELLWHAGACPTSACFTRGAQIVADANATAHMSAGFPADLPVADIPELMARNRALSDSGFGLLVPTLVR